ncbi:unnamed protein product [Penicillium salamii]|nr:unnamed protein product [Penicillium salamii]CAG8417745.1 unnamed protein product [Penicillium salamii]
MIYGISHNGADYLLAESFTSQKRQRVLDQSGDAIFEKHYQSQFIVRDLQHIVLLRPSQEGLVRFAGSILRKRDLSAPSNLTKAHKRAICQNPRILQLKREKRKLMAKIRSVAGTIKNARDTFPRLFQKHKTIKKDLAILRKTLAIETRETARRDYFNNSPVLKIDRQIKQMLLDESNLPILNYVFPKRARLIENFYGPDAKDFHKDKLLARRILVTKDMVALLLLCKPSKRGNRVNWDLDEEGSIPIEQPKQLASNNNTQICPTDVCIICCGESRRSTSNPPPHQFPSKRPDSLRRHLINSHLLHAHDGISCNWEVCHTLPKFAKITEFLAHAHNEHKYDINIKLCHLTKRSRVSHDNGSSRETSMESENRQGTKTPTSSVDFDMKNIDPRLMRPSPITAVKPSTFPSRNDNSTPSSECPKTGTDSKLANMSTQRVTKGAAQAANLESVHTLESSSQLGGQQRIKGQPSKTKASTIKHPPRRSKRLRAQ